MNKLLVFLFFFLVPARGFGQEFPALFRFVSNETMARISGLFASNHYCLNQQLPPYQGQEFDIRFLLRCTQEETTLLHYLANKSDPLHFYKLFKIWTHFLGYSVDHRNRRGQTPLHFAAASGNVFAIERLLEAGSNPAARDIYGRPPLYYATGSSSPRSVFILLKACGYTVGTPEEVARSIGLEIDGEEATEHPSSRSCCNAPQGCIFQKMREIDMRLESVLTFRTLLRFEADYINFDQRPPL